MDKASYKIDIITTIIFLGVSLAVLYIISLYNYLLFHSIAELFSIVIAYALAIVAWNSRRYFKNYYLLFIGIAYFYVASLDVLHTLAYKGMGVFKGFDDSNLPPQIWIAARLLESMVLLIAPVFFRKKLLTTPAIVIFSLITSIFILTIFYWRVFPDCFVTGSGLTDFKINSEHVIVVILFAALALLIRNRKEFEKNVLNLLMLSIGATIITELCFTLYANLYSKSNLVGHLFKILSFYFMYKAIIQTGLKEPYDLLFRDLKQNEEKLKTAKIEADSANSAKSDFLANMSHELRTPLNSIIGFSEIMRDGVVGEVTVTQKEYLNDIHESGQHLLSLINDILDISKVEAGKMELDLSEVEAGELINSSLLMFREKAMKNNIKIEAGISEATGEITADERKIKQVLFNLISNAFKFTPEGGSVSVQARRVSGFIEISVEDTGIGISKEAQKKLFQPFQQIDGGHQKKVQGTGLGLKLCKDFVELHGGRIWIESEEGKGSRFVFVIPANRVDGSSNEKTS